MRTKSPAVTGQLIENTDRNNVNSVIVSSNADMLEVVSKVKYVMRQK